MTFVLLNADLVELIHDQVLNAGELTGRAHGKSLEGALARVDNRIAYGMITDVFDLATAYAVAIARGHCFNDGNKRTAYQAMDVCLDLNGIEISWSGTDVADQIILLAQGLLDEDDFADFLRTANG